MVAYMYARYDSQTKFCLQNHVTSATRQRTTTACGSIEIKKGNHLKGRSDIQLHKNSQDQVTSV